MPTEKTVVCSNCHVYTGRGIYEDFGVVASIRDWFTVIFINYFATIYWFPTAGTSTAPRRS
ncbi:hypothetical protein CW829_12730 [Listeria monocytogenes]|nr:hypothetical protein [Listeria monocytogenes]